MTARRRKTAGMKRLALLFVFGALIGSAQEVRLTQPAILKSGRSIVSLKAGTMVDLLSRDDKLLTVRFNNLTGTIPAASLAAAAASPKADAPKPSAPPQKSGSNYVNAVNKAKENVAKHDKNMAKPVDEILEN